MRHVLRLRQLKAGARPFTKFFFAVKKSTLREAILQQLRVELALQAGAAAQSRDEAISDESRAKSKWDTHSQEAAYLAEGQAKLAAEIGASLEVYATLPLPDLAPNDAIVLGALVEIEAPGGNAWYFLGPRAGGLELKVDGREVLVLTPQSPLGGQMIGKRAGDVVSPPGGRAPAEQRIVSVR